MNERIKSSNRFGRVAVGSTGVNRSFTGSDRHVGCVGHKSGTFHDRLFDTVDFGRQLGEIAQYFRMAL